jgi:hypothetical protein
MYTTGHNRFRVPLLSASTFGQNVSLIVENIIVTTGCAPPASKVKVKLSL